MTQPQTKSPPAGPPKYPLLYELVLPSGRVTVVGKVFRHAQFGGQWVFYAEVRRDVDFTTKYDGWSIAPQVIDDLEKRGVKKIVYFDRQNNILWATTTEAVRMHAVKDALRMDMGVRYHLPRRHWDHEGSPRYKVVFVSRFDHNTVVLQAAEQEPELLRHPKPPAEDPQAEQLSLL